MNILEEKVEIANPQQPHCATVLLLDTSGSMSGNKIKQLNEGLKIFKEEVMSEDLTRKRVDLAVVTFGNTVKVVHNFSSIEDFEPPTYEAEGSTPMGEAILLGINLIEKRKNEYKSEGTDYYRPWIFILTDGEPTDMKPGDPVWKDVVKDIHEVEKKGKAMIFGVGVDSANMALLKQILPPNREPVKLKKGNFKEMFIWLSRSLTSVSASKVGEQVVLENPTGPKGWGEIPTD